MMEEIKQTTMLREGIGETVINTSMLKDQAVETVSNEKEPKHIGSKIVDINNTPFKHYTEKDWALYYIQMYGQIDGGHHKQWVIDQVARILNGTPVTVEVSEWDN
jgi:hypothetical protein